jgi:hypothetical protein
VRAVEGEAGGIDNPGLVDEVRVPAAGPIELVIAHAEAWDGSERRQILLQEKLNRYLEHVIDGELVAAHPGAAGRPWVVVIECTSLPDRRTAKYLRQADVELRRSAGAVEVRRRS